MSTCIFCNTATGLNTEMSISLDDGKKVQVLICDTHAEDATVKSAKAAYHDKLQKLQALLEQAKSLGLDISSLMGAQPAQAAAPVAKPVVQRPQPIAPKPSVVVTDFGDDENVVDTSRIDIAKPFVSTGGQTEYGSVQSFTNYNLDSGTDKLSPEARKGKAHLAMMEGRAGQPIIIPDKRVDGTGTTTIKIVKAENDATLQNRFRKMAGDSLQDKVPDFAHTGYSSGIKDCPFCRGQGTIKNGTKLVDCPKCHGAGLLTS